jgi:ABC-2 type transport system permease protein
MNAVLIRRLILKDWYMSRLPLSIIAAAGAALIALMYVRTEVSGFISLTGSFILLIFLGIILPIMTIVNERKHRNLPFVMSLPISPADYTAAKIIANLSAFVVLWLAIAAGVLGTIARAGTLGGMIPFGVAAALAPFVAFCLLVAVSLIAESELWTIVTMAACNVSYSFAWFFLIRIPRFRHDLQSPTAVWSQSILTIIGIEATLIVTAIVLTFYVQSRKTQFV